MPPTLTKAQSLEIFVQLANAFRATPAEHVTIKSAYDTLAALPEAATSTATTTATPPAPSPDTMTNA